MNMKEDSLDNNLEFKQRSPRSRVSTNQSPISKKSGQKIPSLMLNFNQMNLPNEDFSNNPG